MIATHDKTAPGTDEGTFPEPAPQQDTWREAEEKDDKFLIYMFAGTIVYLIVLLFFDALMNFVR